MAKRKSSVSRTRPTRSVVRRQLTRPPTLTVSLSRTLLPLPIPGRVTDASSGHPIVGAAVALLESTAANARVLDQTVTDRRGQFQIAVSFPVPASTVGVPSAARMLEGFLRSRA
jgi:hypothetical protein